MTIINSPRVEKSVTLSVVLFPDIIFLKLAFANFIIAYCLFASWAIDP